MKLENKVDFDYEKALGDAIKKDAKYVEKLLVEISPSWEYSDLLMTLTKVELDSIRKFYNVKKCSNLNKGNLAERLGEELLGKIEKWFECCLKEDLDLVKDIISKGGSMNADSESPERDYYFRKRGVVFPGLYNGDYKHVIQKDILGDLKGIISQKHIKDMVQRNTEIIETADGLLQYYGLVKKEVFCEIIYDMFERKYDKELITNVLEEYILREENIIEYNDYYQNSYVVDPQAVLHEQENLKEVQYFPLSLQEAKQAGIDQHIKLNQQQNNLMKYFIDKYKIAPDKAKEYVLIASEESNSESSMEERFAFWSNEFEFEGMDAINEFMELLVEVHNYSHLWILKGHTPNSLMGGVEVVKEAPKKVTGKKIGRNEKCPCGSGKKYKKCCL